MGDERGDAPDGTTGGRTRPVDVRRAVLGLLMTVDAPMRVRGIGVVLGRSFGARITSRRISDVLRYQVRLGRVRRVGHGRYEFVRGSMTPVTAWRCMHWERERDRAERRRRRVLEELWEAPGSSSDPIDVPFL